MRRDARVDANQPEIVAALVAVGATVQHLHMVGGGCPDILVGYRGRSYPIEIKSAEGVLTEKEGAWHEIWRGDVYIVRTAEEALRVIGAIWLTP